MAAFTNFNYKVEVLSPVYIGGAKENDYALGEDYFFDRETKEYCFFKKREVVKRFTAQQFSQYANKLAAGLLPEAAQLVAQVCGQSPKLIFKKLFCPFEVQDNIKRHIADGLGKTYLPGSTIKGALRSIIGKYIMQKTGKNEFREVDLFGKIDNNFMRLLQVADVALDTKGGIYPFKIYSGDVADNLLLNGTQLQYAGEGMWKHSRVGGHGEYFDEKGFVTFCECLPPTTRGNLRLNWADDLKNLFGPRYSTHNLAISSQVEGHNWMAIAGEQMNNYLTQEKAFYEKFYNEDFDDVFRILEELERHNNDQGAVVLRLGQGSGYHAITGNWKYADHTQTGRADNRGIPINAIKYKTRKMAFHEKNNAELEFFLPGFVKINISE